MDWGLLDGVEVRSANRKAIIIDKIVFMIKRKSYFVSLVVNFSATSV